LKKILIVGDSQVGCFAQALNDPAFRAGLRHDISVRLIPGGVIRDFVLELAGGATILNPLIANLFSPTVTLARTFWQDNRVLWHFGGAQHNNFAVRTAADAFDFLSPEEEFREVAGPLVTAGLIEAWFEDFFRKLDTGLAEIARLSGGEVYVLQPPPPAADGARMEAYLLGLGLISSDRPVTVADRGFRRKLYDISLRVMRTMAARHGGQFIAAPDAVFDATGLLPGEFFQDPYHANAAYGRIVLAGIDRLLD